MLDPQRVDASERSQLWLILTDEKRLAGITAILMSSLVPPQLKHDSDIDASVKLHVLCRECQRICQNAHTVRIQTSMANELVPRELSKDIFKHHQTSVELEASARKGCHLCSLLYDAFLPYLESIRFWESKLAIAKSHKIKRRKTSYKLEISADSPVTSAATTHCIRASFAFSPNFRDIILSSPIPILLPMSLSSAKQKHHDFCSLSSQPMVCSPQGSASQIPDISTGGVLKES